MDATVIRHITIVAGLLFALVSFGANAEIDLREYRLLKSWGMQADTRGQLVFSPERQRQPPQVHNWSPDLTTYRIRPAVQAAESLSPVVISAK